MSKPDMVITENNKYVLWNKKKDSFLRPEEFIHYNANVSCHIDAARLMGFDEAQTTYYAQDNPEDWSILSVEMGLRVVTHFLPQAKYDHRKKVRP